MSVLHLHKDANSINQKKKYKHFIFKSGTTAHHVVIPLDKEKAIEDTFNNLEDELQEVFKSTYLSMQVILSDGDTLEDVTKLWPMIKEYKIVDLDTFKKLGR